MSTENTSPVFIDETMNFGKALDTLLSGKRIRRLSWVDDRIYLILPNDTVVIFKPEDYLLHPVTISRNDITGTDWIIVSEIN